MIPKHLIVYVFMVVLILTDALFVRFGRIRKRKNFSMRKNTTEQNEGEGELAMYFTRRTTPWPRLKVSIDPSVETHYNRKEAGQR
ncbi:hypothetical protein J6590_015468 [Homalodisca vitripennis]|nr:hypothetical protein J6590_015468 [Homalodisca vitripennis]